MLILIFLRPTFFCNCHPESRAIRDDEMCHEKYGDDWLEYKKRVPYMFVPFVI